MKASMSQLAPVYNTNRMLEQYTNKFYVKALKNRRILMKNDWEQARNFTSWKKHLIQNWKDINIVNIDRPKNEEIKIGSKHKITAEIKSGNLSNKDFEVQIYYGKVDSVDKPYQNKVVPMKFISKDENSILKYEGSITCENTGEFGYTVRVLPKHPLLQNKFELGLIRWA